MYLYIKVVNEIVVIWNFRNRYLFFLYSICFYINVKIIVELLKFLRLNFCRLLKIYKFLLMEFFVFFYIFKKSMILKFWNINLWRIFFLCMRGIKKFYVNLVIIKFMDLIVFVIDCFKDVFKKRRRDNFLSIMR